MGWRNAALAAAATLALAAITARPAAAEVPPTGTVVNRSNIDRYIDVLSPSIKGLIERGAVIKVSEHKKVGLAPPFVAATEKYAGQVQISPDSTHLMNHVAGLPFLEVKSDDPQAGAKHMFNFNSAIAVDDLDLRNFDCDTGALGSAGNPIKMERHFLIDHMRRLYFRERTLVDPKPEMPNRDNARYKEAMYPMIEPFDLKGTGFTSNRYIDHTKQDDSWLYLPQLRRVRRLSSAQRSDALFGQDTDQDSYAGYAGNVGWFTWKFLGEKTMLGSFHADKIPVEWQPPSGDFLHASAWEPREVWVVEGASKVPQYAYSKRVIYLDRESYRILYSDIYDQAGELWKVWVNNFMYAHRPFEGAKYGFDYDVSYNPSISMVDMQLEHATICAMPSARFPGEQGWYINLGDKEGTSESYFELSAIIAAGR